ncbi:MAG: O-antigen ligase family protein [Halothiobacillaceae bacterium]|nr:O-antigen ligase family protein [Halothiobacillaceae bacterium]
MSESARLSAQAGQSASQKMLFIGVVLLPILVLFKRVPAEIAVGVTVLVALWIALRQRDFSWLAQKWLYAAAALSVILFVLSPFSVNPGYSALSAVLAFRWPVFAAALIWLFVRQPDKLRLFEWSVAGVLVFILADTVLQYVVGVDIFGHVRPEAYRLTGPFDHSLVGTFVGRIWFIPLALVWFLALKKGEGTAILIATLMSALGALFLFITGERAALLNYLLGTGLAFVGVIGFYPKWRWHLVSLGLVAILAIGAVAITQKEMIERSVDSTIYTITHLDETVYGLNIKTGIDEFIAHPLTGVGARQFKEYCDTQLPINHAQYNAMGFDGCVLHPHNFYTGMLAEGGVMSFIIFAGMVIAIFATVIASAARAGQPIMGIFGSALLLSTFWPFQSSMEYFNGWTAAVIWTGVAWAIARSRVPFYPKLSPEMGAN